jgi:hypothetical protein
MKHLYKQGLLKAEDVRMQLNIDSFEPLSIFDVCDKLNVSVRIYDNNMEGIYSINKKGTHPTIILSNKRPLPRRFFTCAHELGHHVFGHGSKFDEMLDVSNNAGSKHPDEILVDAFAGHLLMPVSGIETEFIKRNWNIQNSSPVEFFTIASLFAVGYGTLLFHCKANQLISDSKFNELSRTKPAKLLTTLLGESIKNSHFKIIDNRTQVSVIDIEVSNYIIFPEKMNIEGSHLTKLSQTSLGDAYRAEKSGIVRVSSFDRNLNTFVRIQKSNYTGLAEYRHLEN